MTNQDTAGDRDGEQQEDDYPDECPVCGRDVLAEHEAGTFEDQDIRVCDADVDERHQWREDGKIWSPRDKDWVDPEELDELWDMQDPEAPYTEVFSSAE